MARYTCKCGKDLSNSTNPEIEYRVYSDDEWLEIVEDESIIEPILIPGSKRIVWVCPQCERVYLWESETADGPYSDVVKRVYIPED